MWLLYRATAMTSFSLHLCMANSNSCAHFVESTKRFFTNQQRQHDVSGEASIYTDILEEQALWLEYGTDMYRADLVQPILPCGSKFRIGFNG